MANEKPKFSPGLVTAIVAAVFVAVYAGFIVVGHSGIVHQLAQMAK